MILFAHRFPRMIKGYLPHEIASVVIDAQRRNYENKSIPSHMLPVFNILRYENHVNKINHNIYKI